MERGAVTGAAAVCRGKGVVRRDAGSLRGISEGAPDNERRGFGRTGNRVPSFIVTYMVVLLAFTVLANLLVGPGVALRIARPGGSCSVKFALNLSDAVEAEAFGGVVAAAELDDVGAEFTEAAPVVGAVQAG